MRRQQWATAGNFFNREFQGQVNQLIEKADKNSMNDRRLAALSIRSPGAGDLNVDNQEEKDGRLQLFYFCQGNTYPGGRSLDWRSRICYYNSNPLSQEYCRL